MASSRIWAQGLLHDKTAIVTGQRLSCLGHPTGQQWREGRRTNACSAPTYDRHYRYTWHGCRGEASWSQAVLQE